MASVGGPAGPPHKAIGRQASISSLEQSLNMVSPPPSIGPVTIYPGPGARHANLAKADLDIVQRLQQLRGSTDAVPTEVEMAERLAKLKGLPSDHYTKSSKILLNTDRRLDHEKADDLLAQVMEEAGLESRLQDRDEDLEARLSQLRGDGAVRVPSLDSPGLPQDGLDDMDEMSRLLREASAAVSSEASYATPSDSAKERGGSRKPRAGARSRQQRGSSSGDSERNSASSVEETKRKVKVKRSGKKADKKSTGADEKLTCEEEEEVSRIVEMYTKRAAEKKKLRKKKVAAKVGGAPNSKDSPTDPSTDLTDSDMETSGSEKLSDSTD